MGRSLTFWHFQISFFKEKIKVIAFDNRGTGKSSRSNYPYTMEMFVEDLRGLLDYLKIEKKIHLCGISLGGMIALNFVLKYPKLAKTLILCATTAYFPDNVKEFLINQIKTLDRIPEEKRYYKDFLATNNLLFGREFRNKLKEDKNLFDFLKQNHLNDPTRVIDYINQAATFNGYDMRNLIHKIKQPTLIMVGTKDRMAPLYNSKVLHEKIPNSRLEIFKGFGHGFVIENPNRVNNLIWDFIKEH